MRRLYWWLAPAWALGASLYLLFGPVVGYVESSGSIAYDGTVTSTGPRRGSTTLLEAEGASVIVALAVPLLLAALPLAGRTPQARRTLGFVGLTLLLGYIMLASASVGLFFLPGALALAYALTRDEAAERAAPG